MTSFLTDILVTAGNLEKVNLQEKISQIKKEISKLKYAVKEFMDDNYVEFTSKLTSVQSLVLKAEKLTEEMKMLQKRINDQIKVELSGSTKELKSLSESLKESHTSLQITTKLLTLNECMKSIKDLQQKKRYTEVAETLQNMQSILYDNESNMQGLDIYEAIAEEHHRLYNSFLEDAFALLHDHVVWTTTDEEKDKTILSIEGEPEDIENLIRALYRINNLADYMHEFAVNLMGHIIEPIINNKCSVYVVDEKAFIVETVDTTMCPSYKSVFYNLEMLFKFLQQHFDFVSDSGECFLRMLHPDLLTDFTAMLTENCISSTIPMSSEELQKYQPVIDAITEFQENLIKIDLIISTLSKKVIQHDTCNSLILLGFISNDQLFLSDYTENIDQLFINRLCQDFLERARYIMKKDLHDSITHESRDPHKFLDKMLEGYEFEMDKKLSEVSFQLPTCQISKNAKEVLDLARSILDEACHSPESCVIKLFHTCRDIFELYAGLVPEHHKKFLETIPQQVALFHNNCMYLAHYLLTLTHEYRDKLPEPIQDRNFIFADQVLLLRNVGSEHFLEHMRYQRNIIFDILKESGLSALGQTSELHPNTERALRQCIRQLELLKTVWLDVLPENIYCRAIGCITNSMIEDLVIRVVSVEDIPADVATDLVTLFIMVVKRVPPIFPNPELIQQQVKKWTKFLELIKVLGASLKEIEVRWGGGKGPLAREFSATQLKQLVRALFQNTERRSALLATIK